MHDLSCTTPLIWTHSLYKEVQEPQVSENNFSIDKHFWAVLKYASCGWRDL